ncbi:MAG: UbiH/UbiF/VisC/COQ6 family ubiquinone biosynthesis hydroxylase [Bdellovibrionales bacterium]
MQTATKDKKKPANAYDVIIVGGGLSGLTLACLLGQNNVKTLCVDHADPKNQNKDLRTTAISYGSSKILSQAGIWDAMLKKASPINDIQILDANSPLLLQFLSSEVNDKAFGWIVENADLRQALIKKTKSLKSLTHLAPAKIKDFILKDDKAGIILEKGEDITAQLVIGADGRGSSVREWMDIPTRQWSYNQRAVICCVTHENPHNGVAVEHFWPEGPFAVLPMSDQKKQHRSSVVFTEHGPEKHSLMHFSDEEFEVALNARFPNSYGKVKMLSKRAAYPLNLIHATDYIGPRMALVADAAHGIHPIAGQGLNLGFRDVDKIASLIIQAKEQSEDLGSAKLLQNYQSARRFDNMSMVAVTDGLVRLFSNNLPPIRLLRRAGLKFVSKIKPVKQFFMKQAMGER